jgi:diacylglycerol kinase family enzyme
MAMGRVTHLARPHGLLIVNPLSGRGRPDADEIQGQAAIRGVEVRVLSPGDDVQAIARTADGPIGIAGGDGSLGPVAEVALERDVPFVCVPFGTRNHFARDIGLDLGDPLAALAAFDSGRERRIDVGRVGTRVFLNNVSLGLYAHLVHRREEHRHRRDAFARLRALGLSVRDRSPEPFVVDGEPVFARIVLVANNAYDVDVFELGARNCLDEGRLHVYVAEDWFPHTWDERIGERFTIERVGGLRAAVDGEPVDLGSPVELTIEPRALRILVP